MLFIIHAFYKTINNSMKELYYEKSEKFPDEKGP